MELLARNSLSRGSNNKTVKHQRHNRHENKAGCYGNSQECTERLDESIGQNLNGAAESRPRRLARDDAACLPCLPDCALWLADSGQKRCELGASHRIRGVA